MQEIPMPEMLDPNRMLINDRGNMQSQSDHDRAKLLDQGLHETAEYGQNLWNVLDQVRHYLLDSLPPDPRSPGPHPTASASPTGPDDETGWKAWMELYARVNSVLTGPQGDSGYGLNEAKREAQWRRTAPVMTLPGTESRIQGIRPRSGPGRAELARMGLAAAGAFVAGTLLRRSEPKRGRYRVTRVD